MTTTVAATRRWRAATRSIGVRAVIQSTARRYQRCEDNQPPLHEVAVGSTTGSTQAPSCEMLGSTEAVLTTAYAKENAAMVTP